MATRTDIDHADNRKLRVASKRRIKRPGQAEVYESTDPFVIAQELRQKSALGAKERKLARY